jgi:hypothetical protein
LTATPPFEAASIAPPAPFAQETPMQRMLTERALAARGLTSMPETMDELMAAPLPEREVTPEEIQRQMMMAPTYMRGIF